MALLDPALHPLWRDAVTVQIGLEPDRSVVVTGIDAERRLLLNGGDGPPALRNTLRRELDGLGIPLAGGRRARRLPRRLAPDISSAVLVTGSRRLAERSVAARGQQVVAIDGCGRVGAMIAMLLGAAGVGTLLLDDDVAASIADEVPGVLAGRQRGRRRDLVLEESVYRQLGEAAPTFEIDRPADLLVIAPTRGVGGTRARRAMHAGATHLPVAVVGATAVVGPLVVPGVTPCLGCIDAHRRDRDGAWPVIAVQAEEGPQDPPLDITLAALAAAQAAQQVVSHLDGHDVTALGATLETSLPGGRTRRRSWPAHPACGCRWDDPA